jgi:hypothetical protein
VDEPQAGPVAGPPGARPAQSSLLIQLCAEYPDVSAWVVAEALERANRAAALLNREPETGRGRVTSLARDRLDVLRIRSAAAQRRSSAGQVLHLQDTSLDRPRALQASAMRRVGVVDPTRFDRLLQVVQTDAADVGAAVGADTLCRAVSRSLGAAAVAVSAPDSLAAAQTFGVHGRLARWLEELQVTVGEGPSLDGLRGRLPVVVDDLDLAEEQRRWPVFAPAAADAGVQSLCVLPMHVGAARFGVLALYFDRVGGLSDEGMCEGRTFATIAVDLLLDHAGPPDPDSTADPSRDRRFYDDRPEIHQATGMVSVQLQCDLGTALLRLRARAFVEGRLLSELSADVVAGRVRLEEGTHDERRG